MIKKLSLFLILILFAMRVNATFIAPNYAGVLAIPTPSTGAIAYEQDNGVYWQWNGSAWVQIVLAGTNTFTPTVTSNLTMTPTVTNTFTPISTNTNTPTSTPTGTLTNTPTFVNTPTYTINNHSGHRTIIAGIDSLTLSGFSDYLDYIIETLKNSVGDGGPGIITIGSGMENYYGYSLATNGTLTGTGGAFDFTKSPGNYSLNGDGVTWVGAVAGTLNMTPIDSLQRKNILKLSIFPNTYEFVRLYYLQQPSGGTATMNTMGSPSANQITINTNGPLKLMFAELPGNPANAGVSISAITGNFVAYAFEFYNRQGISVNCIGVAGYHFLDQVANAFDGGFYSQWMAYIQPDYFLFNGGRNDAGSSVSGSSFKGALDRWIDNIKRGWPHTGILCIKTNSNSDSSINAFLDSYGEVYIQEWLNGRVGYADDQVANGTYAEAAANSFISGDGIHPTDQGSRYRADNILKCLNFDNKPGALFIAPWNISKGIYKTSGSLNARNIEYSLPQSSARKVLEIALATGGQQTVMVKLEIAGVVEGTNIVNRSTVVLTAQNSSQNLGWVTSFTLGTPTIELQTTGATFGRLVLTFTASINANNRLQVSVNPTTSGSPAPTGRVKLNVMGSWNIINQFAGPTPTPGVQGPTLFQVY